MYKIYKYSSPSQKVYIGQTKKTLKHRAGENGREYRNCKAFYNAIIKYGWDWFANHVEILKEVSTREEADFWETFYIEKYNSRDANFGYNIRIGGSKCDLSKINKRKIIGINYKTKEFFYFSSGEEAAEKTNSKSNRIRSAARNAEINHNPYLHNNFIWIYEDYWNSLTKEQKRHFKKGFPNNQPKSRKGIINIIDNKYFDSCKEAAKYYNLDPHTISHHLNGKTKNSHFRLATEEELRLKKCLNSIILNED